jgi:hypothetical protein
MEDAGRDRGNNGGDDAPSRGWQLEMQAAAGVVGKQRARRSGQEKRVSRRDSECQTRQWCRGFQVVRAAARVEADAVVLGR